jgi:hypothetical protein
MWPKSAAHCAGLVGMTQTSQTPPQFAHLEPVVGESSICTVGGGSGTCGRTHRGWLIAGQREWSSAFGKANLDSNAALELGSTFPIHGVTTSFAVASCRSWCSSGAPVQPMPLRVLFLADSELNLGIQGDTHGHV